MKLNVNKIETEEEQADITQNMNRLIAELLHITRPICHCMKFISIDFYKFITLIFFLLKVTTMFFFKTNSWIQFMVPLIMDVLSLFLMNGTKNMSKDQKKEMKRRTIMFLQYFIRSPLYENYSSNIIFIILSQFEQRIPGSRFLISNFLKF